jgi:hypothetical protein
MDTKDQVLTYKNLIDKFVDNFPEFKKKAEDEKRWWWNDDNEEPMLHIFFGDILNPFLTDKALIKMDDLRLLKRIFGFMEIMAKSEDEDVKGVLTATILERLGDDKKILKNARSLMGGETLKLSHAVEKGWGRE